jgi:glycine/D-amino acid oxidase-like deaminating enzyme
MNNLRAAQPVLEQARIAQAWAGTIDVTPDSNPVIGSVAHAFLRWGESTVSDPPCPHSKPPVET